jgi:hypothetical protein
MPVSRAKKPSLLALPFGGETGPGLAIELCPLAELELFRLLLCLRNLARCMLMKFGSPPATGENRPIAHPGLPPGVCPGNALLFACGVPTIGSSSGSSGSTSSDELPESSEPIIILTLPTELDAFAVLSPLPHPLCIFTFGEFMIIEVDRFRDGMLMPFCVIVGDDSGDDCSGSVEWWRCVQALENSAPRDRRGNSDAAGEAYVFRASSCGERGTRAAKCAGLGMGAS